MYFLRLLAGVSSALASVLIAGMALAADLPALVTNLTTGSFGDRETAIGALAASGDARAAPILEALGAGQLYLRKADNVVVIGKPKPYRQSIPRPAPTTPPLAGAGNT